MQKNISDPTLSSKKTFPFVPQSAFSFFNQVSAFGPKQYPVASVRTQSSNRDTCCMHRCPSLEAPPKDHDSATLKAVPGLQCKNRRMRGARAGSMAQWQSICLARQGHEFHPQHCKTNKRRAERVRTGDQHNLYCCVYRKTKASQRSSAAPCPVQTDDAAHQRSQGQAPALSYEREAVCNAICSLDTTLFYKKNKNKEKKKKNKAWPITPTVCGDHMSTEPTCAMQKPQPHIFTHPTPTYVNHEHRGR